MYSTVAGIAINDFIVSLHFWRFGGDHNPNVFYMLIVDPIWLLTCMSDKPVSAICGSKLEPNLWLQKLVHIRWFLLNLDFLECVTFAILIFGKNSFIWGIKHFLTSSGSNFSNFGTLTHLTFLSLIKELLRAETQLPYGLTLGIWGSK